MTFVADENIDKQIVDRLCASGYEVLLVMELSPGIDDRTVLKQSLLTGSVLLTADKDFGELVFRQRLIHAGVLLIRLAGVTPAEKAVLVHAAIERHGEDRSTGFAVLSERSFRLRKNIQ